MRRESVSADAIPADRPTEWLAAHLRAWSEPEQILQLRLHGPVERSTFQAIRFIELWHLGNELNFYFDLDRHLLYIRDERTAAGAATGRLINPRSEIDRVAAALKEVADSDEERALLETARALVQARYRGDTLRSGGDTVEEL
jgi:hypothetical protein